MALKFYNEDQARRCNFRLHGGRPINDAGEFEQIAKEADAKGEHFFFHVGRLKLVWGDPKTHEKGKITTPTKTKPSTCRTVSASHIAECLYLGFDCDAEKYIGNDPVEAAQHYGDEGQRIKVRN